MDQVQQLLPLQCPHHQGQTVGMLNIDPGAKKIGYCYGCIYEEGGDGSFLKTLKPVKEYLDYCESVYKEPPTRVLDVERPAEYVEELSKKGENLGRFEQYINQQKEKTVRIFEEIRRVVEKIICEKEKEYLHLLDKENFCLSETYRNYEKLLMKGWPTEPDIPNIYPGIDTLKERMSRIENIDQLQAFMAGIQQDVWMKSFPLVEEDLLFRIKKKLDGLVRNLNVLEHSLPKIQSKILISETLENVIKDLMKGFSEQEVQIENSLVSKMKVSTYESKIIVDDQFEMLRDWLPEGYKFDLKLLYRGSEDGMSSEKFHEKCDNKGATIILIRCQHQGAPSFRTIGGFLDQSWHSNNIYSSSKEAFLFLLAEQRCNSVKCPILESEVQKAFYGNPEYGPTFGNGHDIFIHTSLKTGYTKPKAYSNSTALRPGDKNEFNVEEIEVFQVL